MDALLGSDALALGLQHTAGGDLLLAEDGETLLINAIKVALHTSKGWSGMSLLAKPFGSSLQEIIAMPVSESSRLALDRELANALSFVVPEGLASSLSSKVSLVNNSHYQIEVLADGRRFDINAILEIGR